MADTDVIAPALTPEQWARWWNNQGRAEIAVGAAARWMGLPDDPIPDNIARTVALANAALRDDDPRKITRADVGLLLGVHLDRSAPDTVCGCDDGCEDAYQRATESLYALVGKLAALLPPE